MYTAEPENTPNGLLDGVRINLSRLIDIVGVDACAAVPYRENLDPRASHLAGRSAGELALKAIGAKASIAGLPGRRPSWPPGTRGSISHSAGIAIAVVTTSANWDGVGVDIELGTLDNDPLAASVVLSDLERDCDDLPGATRPWTARFSAKEAAFKSIDATRQIADPSGLTIRYLSWSSGRELALGRATLVNGGFVGYLAQWVSPWAVLTVAVRR